MRRIDLRALALDARGVVYVQSREERDKLHAYLSKSVGGGESGRRVSSSGAPPNCSVSCEGMSSSELAHWAKVIGCKATTNPVLDAKAKDAYGYANHNVKKCPGTVYKGGCEGRGRPVPGHVYCAECIKANESRAKDDREYPMPVHRLTGRNPDRCAQCGRPQSDLIHNCTNRFATDRRAKDQVHQDCFDAQILGV